MSEAQYSPGVYEKDGIERVANTASRAVDLVFNGFRLKEAVPAEDASYRDLQAQAKDLEIPANQSADNLRVSIAQATLPGPDTIVDTDDNS